MIPGGVLVLRRRAAGRLMLAIGAGLTLLVITAITLGVLIVTLTLNRVVVVLQYTALIGGIVTLGAVSLGWVRTILGTTRDRRETGAAPRTRRPRREPLPARPVPAGLCACGPAPATRPAGPTCPRPVRPTGSAVTPRRCMTPRTAWSLAEGHTTVPEDVRPDTSPRGVTARTPVGTADPPTPVQTGRSVNSSWGHSCWLPIDTADSVPAAVQDNEEVIPVNAISAWVLLSGVAAGR